MIDSDLIRSWLWIIKYWIVVFTGFTIIGLLGAEFYGSTFYLSAFLIGIPIAIIPATYRNLVGGGCSLRFGICALVKGILAGIVFASLSLVANYALFAIFLPAMEIDIVPSLRTLTISYQIWLFSATIGGFAARIAEVRGYSADSHMMFDGFLDQDGE